MIDANTAKDRQQALQMAATQQEFAIAQFCAHVVESREHYERENDSRGAAVVAQAEATILKFLNKQS